ncbi:hypothetical protein [Atlantibacter subterraneus]|uniref:hypothetical protein n=1 Tax=Atlantibacter subterraneus TaxID=255519 RepID=UPI0022EB8F7E|nr:hypothetical protein [Atlantibacter subterranea]MDA3133597.1 hypothetical protein [Atlantibacter subterranea]
MKDMSNEQLIRATYVTAKYENPQTAQLLTELAGRLDGALAAARTACLERDAAVRAEIEWEKAMMQAVGEDGVGDVVSVIEKLKAERDALAAENGQMLRLLTDISENHLEYLSEGEDCMMAGVPLDYVSEINAYVSRDVEAENPFKATDAFLAEVRASTLEDLAKKKREEKMSLHPDTFALGSVIAALDMQANELEDLAAKLRQGALS